MTYKCRSCIHDGKEWYELPCDYCRGSHDGYVPNRPMVSPLGYGRMSEEEFYDFVEPIIYEINISNIEYGITIQRLYELLVKKGEVDE